MAEYSKIARGSFTSTGAAQVVYLPFQPQTVEFVNYTAAATPANHGIPKAYWDVSMGQNKAIVDLFNATPVLITDSVESNGISTFNAGLMLQYGAAQQVVSSTKATSTFEVTAHGYSTGDVVIFQGLYSTQYTAGMPQIDGMPFVITVVTADTFTINWDLNQSAYTALAASPTGAMVKKVLYPFLYAPGRSFISAITTGTTTTVTTTAPHNLVVGQLVAFRIPEEFGTVELNSLPNTTIPGSPIYGVVTTVTSSTVVVVNIDSSSYTAFDTNIAVTDVPGLDFPQMIAVGDLNTGGEAITATSDLYPSPLVNSVRTINGPAIKGAFVNNTRQGFIIGAGTAAGDTSSVLVGAASDVIYWTAKYYDYSV